MIAVKSFLFIVEIQDKKNNNLKFFFSKRFGFYKWQ